MKQKKINILLIEENTKDVGLTQGMLKKTDSFDFDLVKVSSLRKVDKTKKEQFDLVLLDLNFDHTTGLESYQIAHSSFPFTPIIVLADQTDEKLAYNIVKLGAQDYIIKDTVDAKGLVRAIRYAIERKKFEIHKDEFLGFVSHELKTPVTSIKAYVQLMNLKAKKTKRPEESDLLPFLNKVEIQVDKLTHIINDLLDVTKVQTGKMEFNFESFKIDEIVDKVVKNMQLTTRKHKIVKKGKSDSYVYADKERIAQVLVNLLSNAIKYSPKAKEINVSVFVDSIRVAVSVRDFGMGISKANQAKVFERFFRVDGREQESFSGLGLGLYIASEIIKRQNGRLFVESEEGKGSLFCFELPIEDASEIAN